MADGELGQSGFPAVDVCHGWFCVDAGECVEVAQYLVDECVVVEGGEEVVSGASYREPEEGVFAVVKVCPFAVEVGSCFEEGGVCGGDEESVCVERG